MPAIIAGKALCCQHNMVICCRAASSCAAAAAATQRVLVQLGHEMQCEPPTCHVRQHSNSYIVIHVISSQAQLGQLRQLQQF
jgi:hypothetical protein